MERNVKSQQKPCTDKSRFFVQKGDFLKISKKSEKIGLKIQQVHSRGVFSVACRIKARIPANHHK